MICGILFMASVALPIQVESTDVIKSALERAKVFDGAGKTFRGELFLENVRGVTLKNLKLEGRIRTDRADQLRLENLKFSGKGVQLFLVRSDGVTIKNCEFIDIETHGLGAAASNGLTVVDSVFRGQSGASELIAVHPGIPALFSDQAKREPEIRWKALTTTASAIVGQIGEFRVEKTDGTSYLRIPTPSNRRGDTGRDLRKNRWLVNWGKGTHEVQCVEDYLERGYSLVRLPEKLGKGTKVAWWTDAPERFVKDITITGNQFFGAPSKLSGVSLYFVDGFDMSRNRAQGFGDYGLGVEYGRNGRVADNQVTRTNPSGQIVLAGLMEKVELKGNDKKVVLQTWGSPVRDIESREEIEIWNWYPGHRPVYWLERVNSNGKAVTKPFGG